MFFYINMKKIMFMIYQLKGKLSYLRYDLMIYT
jgi:hypothetical protein